MFIQRTHTTTKQTNLSRALPPCYHTITITISSTLDIHESHNILRNQRAYTHRRRHASTQTFLFLSFIMFITLSPRGWKIPRGCLSTQAGVFLVHLVRMEVFILFNPALLFTCKRGLVRGLAFSGRLAQKCCWFSYIMRLGRGDIPASSYCNSQR